MMLKVDPHWGLWVSHVLPQTKSISTSSFPLVLGPLKFCSSLMKPMPLPYNTRDSMSSSSSKYSVPLSDCNKDSLPPPQGGTGASGGDGSGGRSGAGENGGVWGGFIVEVYGLVGSVIVSVVINIAGFFILGFPGVLFFNVFGFFEASTSNLFFSKTEKNKVTRWWGTFLMNLSYIQYWWRTRLTENRLFAATVSPPSPRQKSKIYHLSVLTS